MVPICVDRAPSLTLPRLYPYPGLQYELVEYDDETDDAERVVRGSRGTEGR